MKTVIILITADQMRSDDLPTHEGLHFDTAGVIELGQRLADALPASGLQPKKEREP